MAFLVVQTHDEVEDLGLPGIREGKNAPEGVHLLSILRGNVRQCYFPIIKEGLDHVVGGLGQKEAQRA